MLENKVIELIVISDKTMLIVGWPDKARDWFGCANEAKCCEDREDHHNDLG